MKEIDDWCAEQSRKNHDGTLTVGEAAINGYYRLREGEYAGRVIIKTCAQVDGKAMVHFANGLTWAYVEKLKDVKCERVTPVFSTGQHPIDYSKASWYDDNGGGPRHYEW